MIIAHLQICHLRDKINYPIRKIVNINSTENYDLSTNFYAYLFLYAFFSYKDKQQWVSGSTNTRSVSQVGQDQISWITKCPNPPIKALLLTLTAYPTLTLK